MKIDDVAIDVMGVESWYAVNNTKHHDKAKEILQLMASEAGSNIIGKEIQEVGGPGLRVFLLITSQREKIISGH